MSTTAYLLLFLGALAGGFVTGLAGFGTALVVLGIWLYVLPPSTVVPLVLICSIVAQTSTRLRFGGPSTSSWFGRFCLAGSRAYRWGRCWSRMPILACSN